MTAGQEDLQRDRRREFVARCATGTWDGIVMSRSAFERIPLSARRAAGTTWTASWTSCASGSPTAKSGDGITVKKLEGALLRAEERLKRQARFGQGPRHHLRGHRHRLPVHRRGARVQEPAHRLQHQRRGDRRVHAGLRPGHEDRLPAPPQRPPGGHLRHRHPDRQLGHRGLRDAALPAARTCSRPRASRCSTPGRRPSARSSPRSSWPPKAAATSG